MPINTVHNNYKDHADDWMMVRDAIQGERAIKSKGDVYLPVPPGMISTQLSLVEGFRGGNERYRFYMRMGEFPEIVGSMIAGIQGLIHEKPPEVELPGSMQYLLDDATPEGDTLFALWEQVTREAFTTGRVVVLCDPAYNDQVRLCLYTAESLINWRLAPAREGGGAVMTVLREMVPVQKGDDPFEIEKVEQFRELRLIEGRIYSSRVWRKSDQSYEPDDWIYPALFGRNLDEIPIEVINATHRGFAYGTIPMIPFARIAVSIYRKSADYYRALYIKTDPQPVLFGVQEDEIPEEIGGGKIWAFSNPEGSASYLDIDGLGVPLQREAINDLYERFYEQGGKLMDTSDRGPESGKALAQRSREGQITIKSTVNAAAEGMRSALRMVGRIRGLSKAELDKIVLRPNMDWAEPRMDSNDVAAVLQLWTSGVISKRTVHRRATLGDITDLSYEDEQEEIKEEMMDETGAPAAIDLDPDQEDEDDAEEG